MMINSLLIAAVDADRRHDYERAAAKYRLVRLARLARRARSSDPVPTAAPVSLHRPAADHVGRHAEHAADHRPAA